MQNANCAKHVDGISGATITEGKLNSVDFNVSFEQPFEPSGRTWAGHTVGTNFDSQLLSTADC